MDSERDKNIVTVILGSTRSRAEINKLGIDSHDIKQLTEKVLEVLEERKNAKLAASFMVTLRLKSRMESIDSNINSKELILQRKTHDWTEHQLGELSDDITSLKEQKDDLEKLLNPSTKYERKRIGEMIQRTSLRLIKENRIGLRKKSSGRPLSMDQLDEEFLLNCIETKATGHGRRGNQVMYTGHRVKKRDFVRLINYHRLQRNLRPIKSATTVYNRSRPHNIRSVQSKRHVGMGLFCTKKPPKTEDNENDLRHHQRSHKKNIIDFLWDAEKEEERKYTVEISMDDKAYPYLCLATSTGMRGTRNQKIFQPCDETKARKLPKYDFPVAMVNVTPSTYRIMTKKVQTFDDKYETEIASDSCYVFFKTKFFVGSPGFI